MLNILKKKNEGTGDIVILISEHEIRQMEIEQENEEAVCAGGLTLPRADAEVKYFPSGGRAFIYGVTPNYLVETENIAQLEKNTVLRNIFDYGSTNKHTSIQLYVMIAALLITVFLLRH